MADTRRDTPIEPPMDEAEVVSHLKTIDGKFMETIESDARLDSGVPPGHRSGDLDFIQMTGLTRPMSTPSAPMAVPPLEDMNPAHPVSFFESGVRDVDHSLSPAGAEAGIAGAAPSPPDTLVSLAPDSIDALRELVSELEVHPAPGPCRTPVMETAESRPAPTSSETVPAPNPDGQELLQDALTKVLESLHPQGSRASEKLPSQTASSVAGETPHGDAEIPQSPSSLGQQLVEAEQLLQELEQQPRESAGIPVELRETEPSFTQAFAPAPVPAPVIRQWTPPSDRERAAGEEDEEDGRRIVYDYAAAPGRRRKSRRHVSRQRRRFIRLTILAGALVLIALGAYVAFGTLLKPMMLAPEDLFALGRTQFEGNLFLDASQSFTAFAKRYPDHPMRPQAEFYAACAMRSAPASSTEAAQQQREQALALFDLYLKRNPGDPRHPRAESFRALLLFELGRYEEVIGLLRDPARLTEDTPSALVLLRTLAMAYRRSGDYEHAESACLQALVLPQNMTPDTDYYELGAMGRERASLTEDKNEKTRLAGAALEYWSKAIGMPGIDPGAREEIKKQMERLRVDFGVTSDSPKTASSSEKAAPPQAAPADSSGVQAAPALDPEEEAKHLEEGVTKP